MIAHIVLFSPKASLSATERQAIREILIDTKRDLPTPW